MPIKQLSLPCAKCDAVMPHNQEAPNHVMHAMLLLLTFGLYALVWLGAAVKKRDTATCTKCGNVRSVSGPATIAGDVADGTAERPAARSGIAGLWDRQTDGVKATIFVGAFGGLLAALIAIAEGT